MNKQEPEINSEANIGNLNLSEIYKNLYEQPLDFIEL